MTSESVQLDSETTPGMSRSYMYGAEDFGRLTETSTTIEDSGTHVYTTAFTYDAAGRVELVQYPLSPSFSQAPEPFTVEYEYNVRGYAERVFQIENGVRTNLFYQATSVDADGQVTGQWLGDGSLTTRGLDSASGRLAFTNASIHNGGTPVAVQNFTYAYDARGNLKTRSDLLRNLTETFDHDEHDRLSGATVNRSGPTDLDSFLVRISASLRVMPPLSAAAG